MKLPIAYATAFLLSFSSLALSDDDDDGKIYIPKEFVALTEDGILVFLGSETVLTNSVYFDENGYYIYDARVSVPDEQAEEDADGDDLEEDG